MDLEEFASLRSIIERHLPEALNFLSRLVAVNSFTANRAGVLRNAELVAAQFRELGFAEERVPAENPRLWRASVLEAFREKVETECCW